MMCKAVKAVIAEQERGQRSGAKVGKVEKESKPYALLDRWVQRAVQTEGRKIDDMQDRPFRAVKCYCLRTPQHS